MADQGPITRQLVDSYSQTVACLGEGPIVVKAECSKVVPASLPLHPEHKGATPESGQVQSTRLLQQCRPPALGGRGVQAADHMVAT